MFAFLDLVCSLMLIYCHQLSLVLAWNNGLVTTPPMGWANWNTFGCNYTDATIRAQAKALVETGLRDVGYNIVIIQECIATHRNASGILQTDPERFPFGMANLVDYIHSLGLLAGIYTDVGSQTCAGYVGSFDHDLIDAETFRAWGIDLIEEDACHLPSGHTYQQLYTRMHNAIEASGKEMIFYMCIWGQQNVQEWGAPVGHLWRTTGDIAVPGHASYDRMIGNFYGNAKFPGVTGPGHWQDPDMLVVGMEGLSAIEWSTHFSLWAMSAAPLWIGVDVTKMTDEVLLILNNTDVIALDQDPLGMAAIKLDQTVNSTYNTNAMIYWKVLTAQDGETLANALVMFNPTNTTLKDVGLGFDEIGMNGGATVRDLWKHQELGTLSNISTSLESHVAVVLRVNQ